MLPLLLTAVNDGRLTLDVSHSPVNAVLTLMMSFRLIGVVCA